VLAARASWKGTLKLAELLCPVALYPAASTGDRIDVHLINRATGHRVRRAYLDSETGETVERDDQVKGYETAEGAQVVLTPEEVAGAVPDSDKVLDVTAFIPCAEVDDVYFDRPYYLLPVARDSPEVFVLLREGMVGRSVAAIARTVLFRRVRSLLIRPHGSGLVATTLNFDYEVRRDEEAYSEIPDFAIKDEMLELARHIIDTRMGHFDITAFDDRYEAALADLVRAKAEGRALPPPPKREAGRVVDLMAALRESAAAGRKSAPERKRRPAGQRKSE